MVSSKHIAINEIMHKCPVINTNHRVSVLSSPGTSDRSFVRVSLSLSPGFIASSGRREGNVLFNDALNTFYLRLYGVRHMVKDHSDSEKGNPLPPHRLLFPTGSKGSLICIIPQIG